MIISFLFQFCMIPHLCSTFCITHELHERTILLNSAGEKIEISDQHASNYQMQVSRYDLFLFGGNIRNTSFQSSHRIQILTSNNNTEEPSRPPIFIT